MKIERRNKKGFTLIELMIVIAIIAILAAILVPNFMKARAQGQLTSCKSNVKNIGTACEMYSTDHNGRYPSKTQWQADLTTVINGASLLKRIPVCPSSGDKTASYNYDSISNPDMYGVWCDKGNHAAGGLVSTLTHGYPQFDSASGLIAPAPGEDVTSISLSTT